MNLAVAQRGTSPLPSERFFNRELSWLEFNWRVLHEARDERTPLMERLRFLGIVGSNLDEFFMKRVGGLKRQIDAGVRMPSLDGRSPQEQLTEVRRVIIEMVREQRRCLLDVLLPKLREYNVFLLNYEELGEEDREHVRAFYLRSVFPVLTPLAVDPGHPFPFLSNLSMSLGVCLVDLDTGLQRFARVKIPTTVNRWVPLNKPYHWIPIEQVIANNLDSLFPNSKLLEVCYFRVTRNADIKRNEEEAEDLIALIEEELETRKTADVVRLEISESMSASMLQWLRAELEVDDEDIYRVPGPLRLSDLLAFGPVPIPELNYTPAPSITHPRLRCLDENNADKDIFEIIREGDLLVHHPYQSFRTSVLRFLETAANDPKVLAIKQTLYRTGEQSPIIEALIRAANNGKQVAALVEIKARFDEANNIEWVKVLEQEGVHVTYGLVGLKTHSKTLLVVRDDPDGLRCYFHIGTGNYHPGTARLYTDLGLLSCDPRLAEDLVHLFNHLTGGSAFKDYRQLLIAPINMRERFLAMIAREIEEHKPDSPGHIIAKMNALEDREIIEALYQASQAGVRIDLIVRGFCCLRPGVPGMSENIRVTSCIGRLLEHSRIFYFRNGGEEEFYIGSGDWMYRNLDTRVEAAAPILDPALRAELRAILDLYLADQRQTWELQPDGSYVQRQPSSPEEEVPVQEKMLFHGWARP